MSLDAAVLWHDDPKLVQEPSIVFQFEQEHSRGQTCLELCGSSRLGVSLVGYALGWLMQLGHWAPSGKPGAKTLSDLGFTSREKQTHTSLP